MFTPPEALRNTTTLDAWRAYSARANRPLIFATVLPGAIIASMTPVTSALVRTRHPWIALTVFAAAVILGLAWLVWAALQVRAYRRAHPFVPPETSVLRKVPGGSPLRL